MKILWALTVSTCLFAHNRPFVTCDTSSNGYFFSDRSRDGNLASSHAIEHCKNHPQTNNAECRANIACSDAYANPMVTCSTSSNSYHFADKSRDREVASSQTIRKCKQHPETSNDECRANIRCDDTRARPMISCNTSSNGYRFSDQSRDRDVAVSHAISKCKQHPETSNDQCRANIACSDSRANPMVFCDTSSNGYRFSDSARDSSVARSHAIKKCTDHRSTANDECRANISCHH